LNLPIIGAALLFPVIPIARKTSLILTADAEHGVRPSNMLILFDILITSVRIADGNYFFADPSGNKKSLQMHFDHLYGAPKC